VCKRFAQKEATESKDGTAFVMHERISASQLIVIGLDLEGEQYV